MPRKAAALHDAGSPGLRDHLVRVTERLIAERRTDGLTVRAIAGEAHVASGVLYNYFADKEELLAYGLLAHVETAARTVAGPDPPGQGSLEANLAAYVHYLLELHERILPAFTGLVSQPKVLARFHAMPEAEKGGDLRQQLAAHLRVEQSLGRLGAHVDTDAAAALVVGSCYELVLPRMFQPSAEVSLDVSPEFITTLVETFLDTARPR